MGSMKLLFWGGAVAVVASAAILTAGVASGAPPTVFAPVAVVGTDRGPGEPDHGGGASHGNGHAFGHHKDSPDFPGNRGPGADKHQDGPGHNGRGNAFGHDKDSPGFPGKGHDD